MIWLAIATGVQFLVLIGLALVVLSLARQVGILHERLTPAGSAEAVKPLQPGERLADTSLVALDGTEVGLAAEQTALLFVAADCPICRSVLPAFEAALEDRADAEGRQLLDGFWVADGLPGTNGQPPDYPGYAAEHRISPERFLVSQELGLSLGVRQIPALVLLDDERRLLVRETLSGPRQLDRLLAAHRR